jgi:hypothetical protein
MPSNDDDKKRKRPSILPDLLLAKAIRQTGKKHNDPWLNETADRLEKKAVASVQPGSDKVH